MKNPRIITTEIPAATYEINTYKVTDEGIQDGAPFTISFCKGDKSNSEVYRQEGVFVESLIAVAIEHLKNINTNHLQTNDTITAIMKLEEALMWLNKRAEDRKLREVQGTYKA